MRMLLPESMVISGRKERSGLMYETFTELATVEELVVSNLRMSQINKIIKQFWEPT